MGAPRMLRGPVRLELKRVMYKLVYYDLDPI